MAICWGVRLAAPEQQAQPDLRQGNPQAPGVQVWQYEGNDTLWDVMQKRDFPYNLEPLLLGRTLDIAKSHRRRLISIRLILRQVRPLRACAFGPYNSWEPSHASAWCPHKGSVRALFCASIIPSQWSA